MKCPEGTKEVSIWVLRHGSTSRHLYFDKEPYMRTGYGVILEYHEGEEWGAKQTAFIGRVCKILKPVMDLTGPNSVMSKENVDVYLFTPEEFELLTRGIEDHEVPEGNG